jgi:YesN/AraC family two-component response regulator
MDEIWKDVPGYKGHYQVSNTGKILSLKKSSPRLMRPGLTPDGYFLCCLQATSMEKKREYKYLHRLVATAFIPNPSEHKIVNHINGIKTDNRATNLEWCDVKYNWDHAIRIGIIPDQKGQGNFSSKLKERQVIEIRRLHSEQGMRLKDIAAKFCISPSTVSNIVNRQRWAHVA